MKNFRYYLLDFEDSFTYNIATFYYQKGCDIEVIEFPNLHSFLSRYRGSNPSVFIWGPGPGDVSSHQRLIPLIRNLLAQEKIFHLGICLGHQLLWSVKGYPSTASRYPLHGQSVDYTIPEWDIFDKNYWGRVVKVQRYNSLIVQSEKGITERESIKLSYCNEELFASYGRRWLTYQFHPESIATEENELFLGPMLQLSL